MAKKQNPASWNELNEIELERVSYLINSDELILETLGETIENESDRFTKPLHMGVLEDINLIHSLNEEDRLFSSNEFRRFIEITSPEVISNRKTPQMHMKGFIYEEKSTNFANC